MEGNGGWLLVYLVASLPVSAFYAAALAGWRLDYPMWLFALVFVALAAPLVLLVIGAPAAPTWNIVALCGGAALVVIRILDGARNADQDRLTSAAVTILVGVALASVVWAVLWTRYFLVSERVANTLG